MNFTNMQSPSVRKWIAGFICTLAILTPQLSSAHEVVLQDGQMSAAFDTDSGALIRLENGTIHWVAERQPELSIPFRLNLFSPAQKHDFIYFQKHHTVELEKISTHEFRFQWKDLVDEQGKKSADDVDLRRGVDQR